MKKKFLALSMATVMCFSLAGCGSSNEKAGGASSSDKASSASSASSSSSSAASTEEEEITCKMLVWSPSEDQSKDYDEWLQTQCEAFNAEHPNWNITFEYGVCAEGDAAKLITQDPDAAADVFMMSNDQLTNLLPINAVARIGGDTEKEVKENNSETMVSSLTVDGALYGIPFTSNTWFMYYDKSVFSEDDIKK